MIFDILAATALLCWVGMALMGLKWVQSNLRIEEEDE